MNKIKHNGYKRKGPISIGTMKVVIIERKFSFLKFSKRYSSVGAQKEYYTCFIVVHYTGYFN